jgi:butyrate kinase
MYRILVINPGSTSTKFGLFEDATPVLEKTLRHSAAEIARYRSVADQYEFREQAILTELAANNVSLSNLDAVVGRGGLLRPIPGGTYAVSEAMLEDLSSARYGEHASNLGAILAHKLALAAAVPAFIVDPVVVDELQPLARFSGFPGIQRRSVMHPLNAKKMARQAARELGRDYSEMDLIVVHMGGGISVGAHHRGRVIDVNNALDGDGPFSPERSGGLPTVGLVELCFSGKYSQSEIMRLLVGKGGLVAYLNTNDGREVVQRIESGDEQARLIYEAMAYQIAKEIGSAAAVLKGNVEAIVLTGGLAYDRQYLVRWIEERVSFIAPVLVYPGEEELLALAEGALRVLGGEEEAQVYR